MKILIIDHFRTQALESRKNSVLYVIFLITLTWSVYGANKLPEENTEKEGTHRLATQHTIEPLHLGRDSKEESLILCIRLGDQDDLLYASLWWHFKMGIKHIVFSTPATFHQLQKIDMFRERTKEMCSLSFSEEELTPKIWRLELTDRQILLAKNALVFPTCSYRGFDPATLPGTLTQTDEKIIYRTALSFEKSIGLTKTRNEQSPFPSEDAHIAEYVKMEDIIPFTHDLVRDQLPIESVIISSMRHAHKRRMEKLKSIYTFASENPVVLALQDFIQNFGANTDVFFGQRYTFVPVPKCGWSTTTRALGSHEIGRMISFSAYGQFGIVPESESKFYEMLLDATSYKFTCVRNPYSRALSSYLDRIKNVDTRQGRGETNPFRKHLGFSRSDNISFLDFLQRLATKSKKDMDKHFRPQWCLTMHDLINYNKIVRLESFASDFKEVMEHIGLAGEPDDYRRDNHATKASEKLSDHYTQQCVDLVKHIYKEDFIRFGYDEAPHFSLKTE